MYKSEIGYIKIGPFYTYIIDTLIEKYYKSSYITHYNFSLVIMLIKLTSMVNIVKINIEVLVELIISSYVIHHHIIS